MFESVIEERVKQATEIDSGSSGSFISRDVLDKLPKEVVENLPKIEDRLEFQDFGRHVIETSGA